jgi:hypothetical protein
MGSDLADPVRLEKLEELPSFSLEFLKIFVKDFTKALDVLVNLRGGSSGYNAVPLAYRNPASRKKEKNGYTVADETTGTWTSTFPYEGDQPTIIKCLKTLCYSFKHNKGIARFTIKSPSFIKKFLGLFTEQTRNRAIREIFNIYIIQDKVSLYRVQKEVLRHLTYIKPEQEKAPMKPPMKPPTSIYDLKKLSPQNFEPMP